MSTLCDGFRWKRCLLGVVRLWDLGAVVMYMRCIGIFEGHTETSSGAARLPISLVLLLSLSCRIRFDFFVRITLCCSSLVVVYLYCMVSFL